MSDHIHTWGDGRGRRKVIADGVEVGNCVYANTSTGEYKYFMRDSDGKPILNKDKTELVEVLEKATVLQVIHQ